MKSIILSSNAITKSPSISVVISANQYKGLEKIQYSGGFLRFHIDLYDEGSHLKATKNSKLIIEDFLRKECIHR